MPPPEDGGSLRHGERVRVEHDDGARVRLRAVSDAHIVNGLIAVLVALFSRQTPEQILKTDAQEVFARLGLERHLSPQRRNGLYSMVDRVRQLAVEAAAKTS